MAFGLCLAASPGIAQQGPPPPPPPPPPQASPPGPGNGDDQPPRNRETGAQEGSQQLSWYNGDYVAESISSILVIDDPVTGFGNEGLWTSGTPRPDPAQSDIARSSEPD